VVNAMANTKVYAEVVTKANVDGAAVAAWLMAETSAGATVPGQWTELTGSAC
jgi:hypothetical protein